MWVIAVLGWYYWWSYKIVDHKLRLKNIYILKNRDHVSCISFHFCAVFEQVQGPIRNFSKIRPYVGICERNKKINNY